jgi:peptide/nickel transport system permease protein
VLSRIIHGSRVSLVVGVGTVSLSGLIGLTLGLLSGYLGGRLDILLMRLVDMMLAIPLLLIAILFAVALGPSTGNVIIALSIVLWSRFARVVRGDTRALREREYVVAARAVGAGPIRVMARHILPNLFNTFVVLLSAQLGWVILSEASLSFLGAGVPAPSVSWGAMVSQGRSLFSLAGWVSFFPGVAIVLLVLSINMIGDWLRDWLDPRLRNTLSA